MPKNKVIKGEDGRYRYRISDAAGGHHELRSRKGERKHDFLLRCDALDRAAETAITTETFDDLFNAWVQYHVTLRCSKAYYRMCQYVYQKFVYPYLGNRNAHDVKRADVYQCMSRAEAQGIAPSTVKKVRLCISAPFAWAVEALGLPLVSPVTGLRYPYKKTKSRKRSRVLSPKDISRILDAARGTKYENYFKVLAITGLRPSEGLGLKARDVNLERDVLEIRRGFTLDGLSELKTELAVRDIPLSDALRETLLDQLGKTAFATHEGWLFPAADGMPSMNAVTNAFKRVLKQTAVWERGGRNHLKKLDVLTPPVQASLYDFRHTFATHMAEQEINPKMLQTLMGHSDIKITLAYYVDVTDEMISKAKASMDEIVFFELGTKFGTNE